MKRKKILWIYVLLLIAVTGTMIIVYPSEKTPLPPRDLPEMEKEGVLRMITEYNQSGYYVSGDTIRGFQYELGKAISDLSGLKVEMHLEMSLEKSFQELASQKYDVIARNIPITSEMKDQYLFTAPVVLNKQVLVQRTEEANNGLPPIRNQLELAGKTLYIPKDSPALLRLRNLEQEIGDTIHVIEDPLYSSEQLIIMVAKNDIDYAVCDMQIALLSVDQFPEIDIKTDISFTQLQSWVVRKDSPILLDSLNSWFRQIRENGVFDRIYTRYYK